MTVTPSSPNTFEASATPSLGDKETGNSAVSDDEALIELLEELTVATGLEGDETEIEPTEDQPAPDIGHGVTWQLPSNHFIESRAQAFRQSLLCRNCRKKGSPSDLVLCGGCGVARFPVHRKCLAEDEFHQPADDEESQGLGAQCEEVSLTDYIFTNHLLDTRSIEENKVALHMNDVSCTWMGVPSEQESGHPKLFIWPRFQRLLDMNHDPPPRQYPSLVSVVGDTGSGKSTLIRSMIQMLSPKDPKKHEVPIPGSNNDQFDSTSSDVHVYADPYTVATEYPRFFVDCEGFSGSANPVARHLIRMEGNKPNNGSSASESPTARRRVRPAVAREPLTERSLRGNQTKTFHARLVDNITDYNESVKTRVRLEWGRMVYTHPPNPQAFAGSESTRVSPETRRIVVRHLYPRLLYAFSDVVCFVTTNARASHEFLSTLFAWATDGHERTLNQHVKPALIVVVNKDITAENRTATVEDFTNQLLRSFEKAEQYGVLRAKWKARGKQIKDARELIECYYDSFNVISIPAHTTSNPPAATANVSAQIKKLYETIHKSSEAMRMKRTASGLDFDVSMLNQYLETSIKVLARDYRSSLDFHELSESDSPLPTKFSEHMSAAMFNLAKARKLDKTQEVGGERAVVADFAQYVAASIVSQVPATDTMDVEKKRLIDEARRGIERFRYRYWRCEAMDKSGKERCLNYWKSHDKGHQFSYYKFEDHFGRSGLFDTLEVGAYQSSWDPSEFNDLLWKEIRRLSSAREALIQLADTAQATGIAEITSQRTCLACMSKCPTNMLPCKHYQHGICEACIKRQNDSTEQENLVMIDQCPLGCALSVTPWKIRVKPPMAGPRILTLDGGGVRGVIEIAMLSQIERAVGFGISIYELFDLVVGTSTGGIVALGVFQKKWRLEHAMSVFYNFSSQAFSIRKRLAFPVVKSMVQPFCSFRYTSDGIEEALKTAFGRDEYLFGPPAAITDIKTGRVTSVNEGDYVKVGVTTCLQGRNQLCLIANYSRNPGVLNGEDDCLLREEDQKKDFKVWEAGRVTSAAPTYFKPFVHSRTNRTYEDGAKAGSNNPVRLGFEESKKIWGANQRPDVIVSLGTGALIDPYTGRLKAKNRPYVDRLKRVLPGGIRKKIETGVDMTQDTLDCHKEWSKFARSVSDDDKLARHIHRLNIGLDRRVGLDDLENMLSLERMSRKYMDPDPSYDYWTDRYPTAHAHIDAIARRLIATLFYFSSHLDGDASRTVEGKILCRLQSSSESARSLLASGPRFRLREASASGKDSRIQSIKLAKPTRPFDNLWSAPVEFRLSEGLPDRRIEVNLPLRDSSWEPVGGFS